MRIAFLILAHTDIQHIQRLAFKLAESNNFHIYIHIDKKADISLFESKIYKENILFIKDRYEIYWGGWNSVKATIKLLEVAGKQEYERYILLQGLDYPLKSNNEIEEFFVNNKNIEYIRGCNISQAKEKYHFQKCHQFYFFDKPNLLKKIINKISFINPVKIRKGGIKIQDKRMEIYWGSAQWALTDECVQYIVKLSKNNSKLKKYVRFVFPPDEIYFHTIIFNSKFLKNTIKNGAETPKKGLVNWRNLHYFEYPKQILVFNENDFSRLIRKDELFIRKVTTENSSRLLDKIDYYHSKKGF